MQSDWCISDLNMIELSPSSDYFIYFIFHPKFFFVKTKFDLCIYTTLRFHITYILYICRYLHSVVNVRTWWEYKQGAFRRTVKLVYTSPLFVDFTHFLALVAIPLYPSPLIGLHLTALMINMHILCNGVIQKNCRNTGWHLLWSPHSNFFSVGVIYKNANT